MEAEAIQALRDKADIVSVAGAYTTLEERTPGDFWGLSPFVTEKTPSFHVEREKQFYKCFTSGNGGDVIDLVRKAEGLNFPQAVEKLEERFGNGAYVLPETSRRAVEKKRIKKSARALPTASEEAAAPDTRSLEERGHDLEFLYNTFGVEAGSDTWCGEYWEYPTFDAGDEIARARRKFRDKAIAKKKYHYVPKDTLPEPCGYPLNKIKDAGEEAWIVNGEPSVWLCWQMNVPAFCALSESNVKRLPELIALLQPVIRVLHILLDNDEAGRAGTINVYQAALAAGYQLHDAAQPAKIPAEGAWVVPHLWTPSTDYARGYDVADFLLEHGGKHARGTLRAVPRAQLKELTGEDEDETEISDEEPPPKTEAELNAEAIAPAPLRLVPRTSAALDETENVVDGNTVRKVKVKPDQLRNDGPVLNQFNDMMVMLKECPRVCSSDGTGYIIVPDHGRQTVMEVDGQQFSDYLSHLAEDKSILLKRDARVQLQTVIGGAARRSQTKAEIFVRVGGNDKSGEAAVYVDIGDESHDAVRVTKEGWEVLDGKAVSSLNIMFRRPSGMRALPVPERVAPEERQAVWDEFRELLRPGSDENWVKMVAWIINCFQPPETPYAGLVVTGQQGSGKSMRSTMLRSLIDPHQIGLTGDIAEKRDFPALVRGTFVMGLTNVSSLPMWVSDALCRVATDGIFAMRELNTTADTRIIEAKRPILLNGITDFVKLPDLKRRCLFVEMEPFETHEKVRETKLLRHFTLILPRLLGVIFDAVSASLRHIDDPDIEAIDWGEGMPDFGCVVAAAEKAGALPWQECGTFQAVYAEDQRAAMASTVSESNVAQALLGQMAWMQYFGNDRYEVMSTMLYHRLSLVAAWQTLDPLEILDSSFYNGNYKENCFSSEMREKHLREATPVMVLRDLVPEDARTKLERKGRDNLQATRWPKEAKGLGQRLKREIPQLQIAGISVSHSRVRLGAKWIFTLTALPPDDSIFDDD